MNENAENTRATAASREAMEKVCRFLKDTGTYYLATADGEQPRVRPFGTIHIFDGNVYSNGQSEGCFKTACSESQV